MSTYRVGLVGFGYIGKVHAFAHRNLPFFFGSLPFSTQLVRVCTGHADSARAAGEFLGVEGVTDFRAVTEAPDIDVVHICTPNNLHREALLSAMAHGKHIYCDKPLTATLEEAEEIAAALPGYHGIAQMTFQTRFLPATQRARQLIREGFLGRPLQFRCSFMHSGNIDLQAPRKWRFAAEAGGGVLADLGSHALDLLTDWLGPVRRVTALHQLAVGERRDPSGSGAMLPVDVEDASYALLELANGACGTLEATKLATGAEDELRLEVHGDRGAIRFNLMDPHHLEVYDATAPASPQGGLRGWTRLDTGQRYDPPACFPAPKSAIGWLRAHVQCLYHFMACVDQGIPAEPGLDQGLAIQRVMAAIRDSAHDGQWRSL